MPRLTIAVIAALVLHVLMLMTILPQQQVLEPEIKGSGQVTVSIVRRSTERVPEVFEKPVEGPKHDEQLEKTVLPQKKEKPIPLPAQVLPTQKPEPVKRTIVPEKRITEQTQKKVASQEVAPEPASGKVTALAHDTPSPNDEAESSEVESLRQPEPLEAVNSPPIYPPLARKRGWQGAVLLEVDVQSDGMVKSIVIKESSSYEMLDREAFNAVRKWRFSPGVKAGKPVSMKVLVPIHFLLQDN